MKKRKGISLIVLIITIIVVIILAAVVILTLSKNNPIESAKEAKILSSLHNVNDSIELYKSKLQMNRLMEDINVDTLIEDGVFKEYVIEETLRPIAVIQDYKKLGINGKFGSGYKNIPEETFEGEASVKKENLNDVCAIDLTNYALYYIQNEKVYSLNGVSISDNILSNFERYDADISEWTFDANTQTLTRYNGDLTQKRGEQEEGEVIIPNYYNGKRVKNIGAALFSRNLNLNKLIISEGIQRVGVEAFNSCSNLKGNLIIPDSVENISDHAFGSCSSLDGNIILGKNLKTIGSMAFNWCSNVVGDLIIPDSVVIISGGAFRNCKGLDGKLVLGKNIEVIGENDSFGAFEDCNNLKGNIVIPEKVKKIGRTSFIRTSITSVLLNQNLEEIGEYGFSGCGQLAGDIVIPENVTKIGFAAFGYGNKVNSITVLNKDAEIYDSEHTFYSKIKIIGYEGSTAEAYATKYNRTFEKIKE